MQLNTSIPASMKRIWQCLAIMIVGFVISDIVRDIGLLASFIFLGASILLLLYERLSLHKLYISASIVNVIAISLMNIMMLFGFSEDWRYGFFGLALVSLMASIYFAVITGSEEG